MGTAAMVTAEAGTETAARETAAELEEALVEMAALQVAMVAANIAASIAKALRAVTAREAMAIQGAATMREVAKVILAAVDRQEKRSQCPCQQPNLR